MNCIRTTKYKIIKYARKKRYHYMDDNGVVYKLSKTVYIYNEKRLPLEKTNG